MKANQQLLRLLVLPFFIFMIALPVLYQSQVLKGNNDFVDAFLEPAQNPFQQDSLPADWFRYAVAQSWFDSAAFQAIIKKGEYDPGVQFMIRMSGMGPDFRHFTDLDTSLTLLALEMSCTTRRFSPAETMVFNASLEKIIRDAPSFWKYHEPQERLALSDSINAFVYGKLSSSGLDKLSAEALISIDSVFISSRERIYFHPNKKLDLRDTLWALKAIYKKNYLPQNK